MQSKIKVINTNRITLKFFAGVLAVAIVCTCAGCKEKSKRDSMHSATATIVAQIGDKPASHNAALTVVDILTTQDHCYRVAKVATESLGKEYTYEYIKDHVSVERQGDESLEIDITFTCKDSDEAVALANIFAEVSCEYIPNVIVSSHMNVTVVNYAAN